MNADHLHRDDEKIDQKRCIACMEIIREGAKICPHCHSDQSPQRWKALGPVLKWVAGLTAVITFIVATKQLNDIVKQWRDREAAVKQYVQAAKMQMELKDYPGAWRLVKQGLVISPESHIALDQEVDVAMAWLREIWLHKGKKNLTEILDPLMLALWRGMFSEDAKRSADVIAHMGWANFLRTIDGDSSYEIDEYFKRSIERDPNNTYAHLFWGYWILDRRNRIKYEGDRLGIAKGHFAAALKTNRERQFVAGECLYALSRSYIKGANVEAIKMAHDLRESNEQIESSNRAGGLELFGDVYKTQFKEGDFLDQLFKQLLPKDVLATYLWLSKDFDFVDKRPFGMGSENHGFVIALLTEATGDLQSALDEYKVVRSKLSYGSSLKIPLRKSNG